MKGIISCILRNGYTKSKKYKLSDITAKFLWTKYIFKENEYGWIVCNHNKFWLFDNQKNRLSLIKEIEKNGMDNLCSENVYDKYGIERRMDKND